MGVGICLFILTVVASWFAIEAVQGFAGVSEVSQGTPRLVGSAQCMVRVTVRHRSLFLVNVFTMKIAGQNRTGHVM